MSSIKFFVQFSFRVGLNLFPFFFDSKKNIEDLSFDSRLQISGETLSALTDAGEEKVE